LDVSFTKIQHVDEIFTFIKTSAKSPCNFALLAYSPSKAIEILKEESSKLNKDIKFLAPKVCEKVENNLFEQATIMELNRYNPKGVKITEATIGEINKYHCIDRSFIDEILNDTSRREFFTNAQQIMDRNISNMESELIQTTECKKPTVIPIPALPGEIVTMHPNSLNGIVNTPMNGASHFIAPTTFYKPFDDYIKTEIEKTGAKVSLIQDLQYHFYGGEIHCGSLSAPICKPRHENVNE